MIMLLVLITFSACLLVDFIAHRHADETKERARIDPAELPTAPIGQG
jgi:hypothetical protein